MGICGWGESGGGEGGCEVVGPGGGGGVGMVVAHFPEPH